jgi:hypothetical protein
LPAPQLSRRQALAGQALDDVGPCAIIAPVRTSLHLIILSALLTIVGCDFLPWDKPEQWDTHWHGVNLYVRTINHALDTAGLTSCRILIEGIRYARPCQGEGDMNYYFGPAFHWPVELELVYPDSGWHMVEVSVPHYIGYQQHLGLDTGRLSVLGGGSDWSMHLHVGFSTGTARFQDGRTWHTLCFDIDSFPDNLSDTTPIEAEFTCDLSHFGHVSIGYDTSLSLSPPPRFRPRP